MLAQSPFAPCQGHRTEHREFLAGDARRECFYMVTNKCPQDSNLYLRPPSPLTQSANLWSGTTFCCACQYTTQPVYVHCSAHRAVSYHIEIHSGADQALTGLEPATPRPGAVTYKPMRLVKVYFYMVGLLGFEPRVLLVKSQMFSPLNYKPVESY